MTFSKRLSNARKERGLTQSNVAEKLNVSFQAVSSWERGETTPEINKLEDIASLYQVSLDWLLTGKTEARVLFDFQDSLSDRLFNENTTKHGGTGQSPLEKYLASNGRIRRPVSREWLDEAFHNRVIRNVNRDATVHLLNACYDAPMQFIGQKVEVRFLPGDTESAYILYGGQHYPLCLTDRVANGRTKRQTALSIDYAKEGRGDVH